MSFVNVENTGDGIATLILNDPDRRNAMGEDMAAAFRSAIGELSVDSSVRVLIITGAGKAFAAGGDLNMLKAKSQLDAATNRERMLQFYESFLCIQSLRFPTIAAVNGHAIGAGLCVAMACDFRVIASNAKLGFTFTKLALHPGMGASLFVPRIAGMSVAIDLLVSGRLFSPSEALSLRLTQHVVDPQEVISTAQEIAFNIQLTGPQAVAGLLETLRPTSVDLRSALEREAEEQARGYARQEFIEGVTATIEKRPPRF